MRGVDARREVRKLRCRSGGEDIIRMLFVVGISFFFLFSSTIYIQSSGL